MKFKLISGKELLNRTVETIRRFPLVSVFLFVGVCVSLYENIGKPKDLLENYCRNLEMSLGLLIPVLYSIKLSYESGWIQKRIKPIGEALSLLAAVFYFAYLPDKTLISLYTSQYVILMICSVLLCLVCIKQGLKDDDFYWQFIATIFVRLFITWLYTVVIIGGTSAALGAIDALFKTDLMGHQEARIVIVTLWLIAPLLFLSGVSSLSNPEEVRKNNTRGVKNLGIYVMIPLTIVYLGILYAYGLKILLQWKLPEGTISYLVLSFATFGIVSLLVIYPFRNDENSMWGRALSKYFYYLQIPLLVLLYLAIFTRVFQYGITFRRYYVLALAVWLSFITIYMIIKKNRNIMMIPFSLLILGVLSITGPWSSFNISFISQKNRLFSILSANSLIQGDKLVKAGMTLKNKTKVDISSIVKYLNDYGKLKKLYYLSNSGTVLTPESFTQEIGFKFDTYSNDENMPISYRFNRNIILPAKDFKIFARFEDNNIGTNNVPEKCEGNDLSIIYLPETNTFQFIYANSYKANINLKDVVEYFREQAENNPDKGKFQYKDDHLEIICLFNTLYGSKNEQELHVYSVAVTFLVNTK